MHMATTDFSPNVMHFTWCISTWLIYAHTLTHKLTHRPKQRAPDHTTATHRKGTYATTRIQECTRALVKPNIFMEHNHVTQHINPINPPASTEGRREEMSHALTRCPRELCTHAQRTLSRSTAPFYHCIFNLTSSAAAARVYSLTHTRKAGGPQKRRARPTSHPALPWNVHIQLKLLCTREGGGSHTTHTRTTRTRFQHTQKKCVYII